MKGLYAWVGLETAEVVYQPAARGAGRSSFSPFRLVTLSLDGLTAFTTWPLRVVSAAGLALALLALLYGAYLIIDYSLHGHPIPGYTTIVVGLALWATFALADEIFLAYTVEAVHLRLFGLQLVSVLALRLLPE